MGGAAFDTLEGNTLEVGCDGESLTVNGVKMVNRKDIVTTNGVIHLLDQVLIPDSAKQVTELAGPQQATFTDLVGQLGLAAALRPEEEYTLLAPVNGAFSDDTLTMDQRILKLILQNHILKVKIGLNELYNGQFLETLGGKKLRVFVYRTGGDMEDITSPSLGSPKEVVGGNEEASTAQMKPFPANWILETKDATRICPTIRGVAHSLKVGFLRPPGEEGGAWMCPKAGVDTTRVARRPSVEGASGEQRGPPQGNRDADARIEGSEPHPAQMRSKAPDGGRGQEPVA
ncbi:UNVERIFIED_CONTAM: hypothetical protein K2H54_013982 [Gekko kuhli]